MVMTMDQVPEKTMSTFIGTNPERLRIILAVEAIARNPINVVHVIVYYIYVYI